LALFAKYFPEHPVLMYFIINLSPNNSPATYPQTFFQYIFSCVLFSHIFFIHFLNIFSPASCSQLFSLSSVSEISSSCYCSQTFFQHPFLIYLLHIIVLKHLSF
jgi:hypothetical protein